MNTDDFEKLKDNILTREDMCKLFKKSEHTILNWSKSGLVKVHKIGNSCYYMKDEVMECLLGKRNTDAV